MTTHSADLQWLLIKNNSSFLVRRKDGKAATFTTEPNNLTNRNSWKHNGLVNKKVVDVVPGPDNRGIILRTKRKRTSRRPSRMFNEAVIVKGRRHTYRAIRRSLGCANYRVDLLEIAVRRASAILASQRPRKISKKHK